MLLNAYILYQHQRHTRTMIRIENDPRKLHAYIDQLQDENAELRAEQRALKEELKKAKDHGTTLALLNIIAFIICITMSLGQTGWLSEHRFYHSFGELSFTFGLFGFWMHVVYMYFASLEQKLFPMKPRTKLDDKALLISAGITLSLTVVSYLAVFEFFIKR